MEKLEQRMRQLRTSEGLADWDDFDGTLTAGLQLNSGCPRWRGTQV